MPKKGIGRTGAPRVLGPKDLASISGGGKAPPKAAALEQQMRGMVKKPISGRQFLEGVEKIPGIGGVVKGIDQAVHHQPPTGFLGGFIPGLGAGASAVTSAIGTPLANGARGVKAFGKIVENGAIEAVSAIPGPEKFAGTAAKIAAGTAQVANYSIKGVNAVNALKK